MTMVKLSSCPEEIFAFSDEITLPTGLLPGQASTSHWSLQRVGVKGTGMNKILIEVQPLESSTRALKLSGIFDHGLVRVETQRPFHAGACALQLLHCY